MKIIFYKLIIIIFFLLINGFCRFDNVFAANPCDSMKSICLNFTGLAEFIGNKTMEIDFLGGQNHLGGMIIIINRSNLSTPQVINRVDPNNSNTIIETKTCRSLIGGYYYNRMRGNVVYPLDQHNKDVRKKFNLDPYKGIVIKGGLYTACDGDPDSVYGDITYTGTGNQTMFHLVAGVGYDYKNNSLSGTLLGFKKSFQFFNGVVPVGLMRDSDWGIGFVGGKLISDPTGREKEMIQTLITKTNININNKPLGMNTFIETITNANIIFKNIFGFGFKGIASKIPGTKVIIDSAVGIVGNYALSKAGAQTGATYLSTVKSLGASEESNTYARKGSLIGGEIINLGSTLNKIKQGASMICRGKNWETINDLKIETPGEIYCIRGKNGIINKDLTSSDETTIVIEGGDLIINASQKGPGHLNVFIDKGYLKLDNNINTLGVDINGEYTSVNNKQVGSGAILQGNYYVNGLLVGYGNGSPKGFIHKLYIPGLLASFNTINVPGDARVKVVKNSLGLLTGFIEIQKAITWVCDPNGIGTDGNMCNDKDDKYANNVLIVLKRVLHDPFNSN